MAKGLRFRPSGLGFRGSGVGRVLNMVAVKDEG